MEKFVEVSCPCPMAGHAVSCQGFSILERIQTTLSTRIQNVVTVKIERLHKVQLDVLGTRMRWQIGMVTFAGCNILLCEDLADAENLEGGPQEGLGQPPGWGQ